MKIQVHAFRTLNDNYSYLLHRADSKIAAVIDPSDSAAVISHLNKLNLQLGAILNTHHHHDHVGGNLDLKSRFHVSVYCSAFDRQRVPGADKGLNDNEVFCVDGIDIKTLSIPGHTSGQIAYLISHEDGDEVFVGDTLFAMGCGRLFEGTPQEMTASLEKIRQLHPRTKLHFGHEYTERNAAFAKTVEPSNVSIDRRLEQARAVLQLHPRDGVVSAPRLQEELQVNPFLRLSNLEIRKHLGLKSAIETPDKSGAREISDVEVFRGLRALRDNF